MQLLRRHGSTSKGLKNILATEVSTQRRQRIWTSRTRSSRTYEGAAFRQFSRRHQGEASAPAQIKHKMLRGLMYNLQGYAVTKRSPDSIPGQELSVLQQCSLVSLNQDARCDPTNLHALTSFLVVNTA
ncbi:hypothetical protein C6341_g3470 [Phytophthora cactorum]|nr:hypothetical protein C6341_g3470 [Phytophthora cactorum]